MNYKTRAQPITVCAAVVPKRVTHLECRADNLKTCNLRQYGNKAGIKGLEILSNPNDKEMAARPA